MNDIVELVPVWDPSAKGPNRGYLNVEPFPARPPEANTRPRVLERDLTLRILDILGDCPGLTQLELRAWTFGGRDAVNHTLLELERKDLVRVERDELTPGVARRPCTYFVVERAGPPEEHTA
jgi:hypothetical protein